MIALLLAMTAVANDEHPDISYQIQQNILRSFSATAENAGFDQASGAWVVQDNNKIVGYFFASSAHVTIPAYSGQPINIAVALDHQGQYKYAWVIEHHEPILLVGIPEQTLNDFAMQYVGYSVVDNIRVSANSSDQHQRIDAITGATVTAIVVNETIVRASRKVALALGLIKPQSNDNLPVSLINNGNFAAASWRQLIHDQSIRRLHLTHTDIETAFLQASPNHINVMSNKQDTFIDLYYAYLNPAGIGQNLLGASEYQWLMGELKPGEHAIAVMANGEYSFRGNAFVRGGIFDRVSLSQKSGDISFRDLDYHRLVDIYAEGYPEFSEMAIFIIREHFRFDPGLPWNLNLLVRRQIGPIESRFVNFSSDYQTPETYLIRPSAAEIEASKPAPLWLSIWRQKSFQLFVLLSSLLLLISVIFMQDWLVKYPRFIHGVRRFYLIYTVFFIGWYGLGQLSVVNVLTFAQALFQDFSWELFLMDPFLFVIWTFTTATILLWGRGIFCGWLCPFGALQELINELARKLKIKQFELPFVLHEKLWAVKYLILLVLFGVSLESLSTAEKLAEVEPFKTTFLLSFQRQWWFVVYAVLLLLISIFTRKVYCRYICPLGAALAIPSKLRMFDWLKRRAECGSPCKLCANECEIQAIHPDGRINHNECHHCLDCQVTYYNAKRCPPLVMASKKNIRTANDFIEIKNLSNTS